MTWGGACLPRHTLLDPFRSRGDRRYDGNVKKSAENCTQESMGERCMHQWWMIPSIISWCKMHPRTKNNARLRDRRSGKWRTFHLRNTDVNHVMLTSDSDQNIFSAPINERGTMNGQTHKIVRNGFVVEMSAPNYRDVKRWHGYGLKLRTRTKNLPELYEQSGHTAGVQTTRCKPWCYNIAQCNFNGILIEEFLGASWESDPQKCTVLVGYYDYHPVTKSPRIGYCDCFSNVPNSILLL